MNYFQGDIETCSRNKRRKKKKSFLTDLNIANSTPSETPYNFVGFCHKMTCVLCVFVLVVNKEKSSNFALTTEVT